MRFKKPFKAVPINPDPAYLERRQRRQAPIPVGQKPTSPPKVKPIPSAAPAQQTSPVTARNTKQIQPSRKPSRITPRRRLGNDTKKIVILAALFGSVAGVGSVALEPGSRAKFHALAVEWHLVRAREPQAGDYWSECSEAKAAGTYPIGATEPGYRSELDRDGDGIACERYQGT
ncbi:excalibur calcium-binding domain-containing protein [Croceicoccus bisphenolivorans]|uniref:excalibur calcium-binding domain-containing protein n=1 Tax=Croceicoccus bisphenolivorans TaxID=1783232 RepID=UPI0009ED3712